MIDGCGEFTAFWRVLLPLARPGLVTVAIFQFIGVWKEYFFAFMLVGGDLDGSARTLPLGLGESFDHGAVPHGLRHAFRGARARDAADSAIYLLLQRQIVKGVAAGALKG